MEPQTMSSPANKPEWYTIATTSGCIELMACSIAQALRTAQELAGPGEKVVQWRRAELWK
jgi:hypothetical protein